MTTTQTLGKVVGANVRRLRQERECLPAEVTAELRDQIRKRITDLEVAA